MTQTPESPNNFESDSYRELRQRLEELDDATVVRALAVMDIADELHRRSIEHADELHRQSNERIDRIAIQIDRNALAIGQLSLSIQQLVNNANADRAVMLEILQYLRNQHPGNGRGELGG